MFTRIAVGLDAEHHRQSLAHHPYTLMAAADFVLVGGFIERGQHGPRFHGHRRHARAFRGQPNDDAARRQSRRRWPSHRHSRNRSRRCRECSRAVAARPPPGPRRMPITGGRSSYSTVYLFGGVHRLADRLGYHHDDFFAHVAHAFTRQGRTLGHQDARAISSRIGHGRRQRAHAGIGNIRAVQHGDDTIHALRRCRIDRADRSMGAVRAKETGVELSG